MDALNRSYQNDFGSVEIARDAGGEQWIQAVDKVHHSPIDLTSNGTALSLTERLKIANYKVKSKLSAQFKYEVLKKEIENDPELLKNHLQNMVHRGLSSHGYHQKTMNFFKFRFIVQNFEWALHYFRIVVQIWRKSTYLVCFGLIYCLLKKNAFFENAYYLAEKITVNDLIEKSVENVVLTEMLLYDVRCDTAWKANYTKKFSKGRMKVTNGAGWTGISSDFFARNEKVDLEDARSFILYQRLTRMPVIRIAELSKWLENDELNYRNSNLEEFFIKDWDGMGITKRMNEFIQNVQNDLDRVRLQDRCNFHIFLLATVKRYHGLVDEDSYLVYNNIVMWEALIASRKQVFIRSMIGGMERRFEILDNQVNHIAFTHHAFDEHLDLCRNKRIKCRDSTRVVLTYPSTANNDFIHANYIQGAPLFNKFIITQAPMKNTIGDFWRMVWQERSPYIFMLISRKEDDRCAQYWPRLAILCRVFALIHITNLMKKTGDQITYYGLTIMNSAVDEFRLPLFRVTYLIVVGPERDELHVEHWQGDMNNSDNVMLPLQLLRLARNCSYPTIIHCHLGISRSATLVAVEICIACLLKGPTYKV
ncbi:unnamed protein product, partial [Brugia timori]|uniref:Protein tyrosine phosphatase n=1 Tax=Brugia timori TaxID=42155 RepID=A0A0R3QNS7_9BILA